MFWLRKTTPGEPLVISMTGLRLGDRVLFVGCSDPRTIAQLALKPGLTGRAVAVDDDEGRTARAADVAQREGALLEVETTSLERLPFDMEAFDAVIIPHLLGRIAAGRRHAVLQEASRVLRSGGRCIAIEKSSGMFGGARISAPELQAALSAAGFRGTRTLAERGGLIFVEGGRRD